MKLILNKKLLIYAIIPVFSLGVLFSLYKSPTKTVTFKDEKGDESQLKEYLPEDNQKFKEHIFEKEKLEINID
jgi:hypothetical protein